MGGSGWEAGTGSARGRDIILINLNIKSFDKPIILLNLLIRIIN
jgi:hypothetical protein